MKLLCKKKLVLYLPSKVNRITPGKYYHFQTYKPKEEPIENWYFCENDLSPPQREWFTSTDKNSSWYIWDYFYTPQEERKMKLGKLYETTL